MPCKFSSQLALFQKVIVLEKPVALEWWCGDLGLAQTICIRPGNPYADRCHRCVPISSNLNALSHFAETKYMYTHYLNLCKDLILKIVKDDM